MTANSRYTINLTDCLLVGEYTTGCGPYCDDHFLVFITKDGVLHELAASDARIVNDKGAFAHEILCRLANSTELQSVVLFPEEIKGNRMFNFEKIRRSFVSNIIDLFRVQFRKKLTPETTSFLKSHGINSTTCSEH